MKMNEGMEKVVDIITEILAFFTVALIVLLYVNSYVAGRAADGVGFIPAKATQVLKTVREITILLVVGLAGLQFSLKHLFLFIPYALLVAAAVIFMFFPNVLPVSVKDVLMPFGI